MAIFLPRRWSQQPQYPVAVDTAYPLTNGLFFTVLPYFGLSQGWSVTGTPTLRIDTQGRILEIAAAQWASLSGTNRSLIQDQMSWLFDGVILSSTASNFIFGYTNPSTFDYDTGFYVAHSATPSFNFYIRNASNSVVAVGLGGVVYGQLVRLLATYDGTDIKWYRNDIYLSGGSSQTGNLANTSGTVLTFNRWAGQSTLGIRARIGAIWNRALPEAEAAEVLENPWQLFRPAANQTFYSLPSPAQVAGTPQLGLWGALPWAGLPEAGSSPDVSVSVTGVSATGAVGTATVTGTASTSVTGVTATGAVGTATATGTASTSVTGVSATGAVGTAAATGSANVSVTGVSGTGAVGSVATPGNESVSVTGVAGTGAVGTVTATGAISVSVTGVAGTGAVGSATVTTTSSASVAVTGVSGTGAIGNEAVTGTASVPVTGVQATGQVGAVVVPQNASTTLTGVAATGAVGSVTATAGADISVSVTGTQAIASVGSVAISIGATVFPIGVVCVAQVTPVLVWGPVDDSQTPSWVVVNDSNTVTWTQVIT